MTHWWRQRLDIVQLFVQFMSMSADFQLPEVARHAHKQLAVIVEQRLPVVARASISAETVKV
jgi:hypothetical protein